MEDLDLDELDKQVNKMMLKPRGNKRLRSSRAPQAITRPSDVSAPQPLKPLAATPPEVASEPASSPVSQSERTNRPLPTIPTRSRLRPVLMDIVSTAPAKAMAPSARPTRTSADIRPPSKSAVSPDKSQTLESSQEVTNKVMAALSMSDVRPAPKPKPSLVPQPAEPQEQLAPASEEASTVESELTKPASNWPDPLDFLDYDRQKPKEEPAAQSTEEQVAEPQQAASVPEPTPFVTTKVEKRPLGAYASASSKPEVSVEPEAPIAPAETNKGEMAAASLQSQQHVQDMQPSPQDLQSMTIPQQYHAAQPEQTDQVRSVYDTKEYHAPPQPMYHSRKGSPWFVVGVVAVITLIILLVLVGYFMATGTFNIKFGNISSLA